MLEAKKVSYLAIGSFWCFLFRTYVCDMIGKLEVYRDWNTGSSQTALIVIKESESEVAPMQQKEPSVTLRQNHNVYITIPARNTSICRLLCLDTSEARNIQCPCSREGNIV